jgi:hypothetical protein
VRARQEAQNGVRDARVRAADQRETAARQLRDEKLHVKEQQRRAKEAVRASRARAVQRHRLRSWTTGLWMRVTRAPHRHTDG